MRLNIEKRLEQTFFSRLMVIFISIFLAVLFIGIVLYFLNFNPFEVFKGLIVNAFLTKWGIMDTIIKSIPLLIIALGLCIVFKMEIWNIGGEGQFYMGAIAATWVAIFLLPDASSWLVIPVIFLAGFIAGAFWGAVAGVMRAYLGVNEIVGTLMLNYIAILYCDFLVYGPWRDPEGLNFPVTKMFPAEARLGNVGGTGIHTGIIFALILAVFVYYFINKTSLGFEMNIIGDNEKTAEYAGINVSKNIVLALMISGGISGFAGAIQMAGIQHQLQSGFSTGYGYTAIIVAWLAHLNPAAVIITSLLMGGLYVGGEQVQLFMGVPLALVNFLQASILFFLLAGEFLNNYRVKIEWGSSNRETAVEGGEDIEL